MKGYLVNPTRGTIYEREGGYWTSCKAEGCSYQSGTWAIHYQAHENLEAHIIRVHGPANPDSTK